MYPSKIIPPDDEDDDTGLEDDDWKDNGTLVDDPAI